MGLALAAPPAIAAVPQAGPAWWKVSDGGGSVLWIMAVPDGMLMDTQWSEEGLKARLASARLLVSPLLGAPPVEPPPPIETQSNRWIYWIPTAPDVDSRWGAPASRSFRSTLGRGPGGRPPDPPRPLFEREPKPVPLRLLLPAGLNARVEAVLSKLPATRRVQIRNARSLDAALYLDLWNWPPGELGNPVTTRAQEIAKAAKVEIDPVFVPGLWRPVLIDQHMPVTDNGPYRAFVWLWDIWPNLRTQPPEAVQQKCLERVVAQSEGGRMPALRLAATAAWARGDVANALRRSNTVQYCLMGDQPSTDPAAFIRKQAYLYIQALERAWTQDGETVALVEFDALLLEDGGVLDHYRRLGYEIEAPP